MWLEPIGLGTACVESLTSYVARLAWWHGFAPSHLVTRVIAPQLGAADPVLAARWVAHLDDLLRRPPTLNSHAPTTAMWVEALEALTLRTGLAGLTLLPWREVLPLKHLLRARRAWCAACLAQWRSEKIPVHEPLIWQFSVVTACPIHRTPLATVCPNPECGARPPVLTSLSRPGECPRCRAWLGSDTAIEPLDADEAGWQGHVADEIGSLLAATPTEIEAPDGLLTNEAVRAAITRSGLTLTGFAARMGVALSTVSLWKDGRRQPSLPHLLRAARAADVPLLSLLRGDVAAIAGLPAFSADHRPFIPPSTEVHRRHDWPEAQQRLVAMLAADPPVSLRAALETVDVDEHYARSRDSRLCHDLAERYRRWTADRALERIAAREAALRTTIADIRAAGLKPSKYRVQQHAPRGVDLRRPELFALWQAEVHGVGEEA
jgi:transcriptional regulator with XRE-family HTH domain